ncbi:hypothetical protein EXIGLDRAFT_359190 [Exidia glandulosa HHB12029]|uniref:Uncharacterized protein n=1 Tax=Exidia glandulosa HHB12029 TaxID=1314781 RepID=A0A165C7V9_EXIGL|nr:hypothetical protein EXIGLDRAFT_359190 [Exidia glandulosa HHB12029]
MRVSVEMWLQASSDDELSTPREFDEIVKQLRKIEREWANRVVAAALSKGPETNAWLDGISSPDAEPQAGPSAEIEPLYTGEFDGLISPEDAIERRHAQAEAAAEADKSVEAIASHAVTGRFTTAVIENPTHEVNPVKAGTFVLIQVDPIASVAALDDEQATREAATLTPKRVLALYDSAINMEYSAALGGLRMNASFRLAGHGRPPPPFDAAAVPISPATAMFDPDRNPLRTSPVLPWDDCFFYTLEAVTATVSRIHQHSVPGFQVAREEKRVYRLAVIEDSDAFAKLGSSREAWYTNEPDSTGSVVPQDDDGAPSNTGTEVVDVFPHLFQPDDARRMRLSVEMWLSASATDELASPRDFDATVQALKRIEREWANRFISKSMAKTPETNAWLEGVAGANEPVPPPESEHSYTDELDDLVQPEDAIEHRIAQTVVPPISSENRLTDPSRDSSNHVAETGNPPLEELQAGSQTLAHAGVPEPEAPASVESEAPMGHEAGARSDIDGPKSTEKPRKQRAVTRYLSRPLSFIQHVTARIRALPR